MQAPPRVLGAAEVGTAMNMSPRQSQPSASCSVLPVAASKANRSKERRMIQDFRVDRESSRSGVRRQFAKIAVAAMGVAGLTVAGLAGASAHGGDGWDDDAVIAPSGGFVAPGGLDDNG